MSKNRGLKSGSTRNKKKVTSKDVNRAVQDRTFGMKNKKGKKAQEVAKQVHNTMKSKKSNSGPGGPVLTKKQLKEMEKEKLAMFGVDVNATRIKKKQEKKAQSLPDLYIDMRCQRKNSTFEDDLTRNTCDHYREAVEDSKLGWFWICPNGSDCSYRHAFPEGYVVEKKKKVVVDNRTLEQIIEDKRRGLSPGGTKITLDTFNEWKIRKQQEEAQRKEDEENQRKKKIKSGKEKRTGREVFMETTFVEEEGEDDEAFDLSALKKEKEDEENQYDIEAAAKANEFSTSDNPVVFEKNGVYHLMFKGKDVPFDHSLFIQDESIPDISELE